MRWIRFAVLIIIVSLLQADAIKVISIKGISPNLLLILMVFFAIHCNTYDVIIASFTIGFAADLIGGAAMGVEMLSFGILGILLSYLGHDVIQIKKRPQQAVTIFTFCMLTGILSGLLSIILKQPTVGIINLFFISLYSAMVGPFLFMPILWLMRIKAQR
jgi:rod shape-determining protein MreD